MHRHLELVAPVGRDAQRQREEPPLRVVPEGEHVLAERQRRRAADAEKRSPARRTTIDGTVLYSDALFCTGTSFTTDLDVMRVFTEKHSENHLTDENTERTPLARPLKKRSFYR